MPDKKPSREQSGLYNLFARYVKDDGTIHDVEFAEDVKTLRKSDDILQPTYENVEEAGDSVNADEIPSPFAQFMYKYQFPNGMSDFIQYFITHGKIDPDKLRSGVYLVDDDSMQASGEYESEQNFKNYIEDTRYTKYVHVTLALPVDATRVQIDEAIAKHQDFIKSRQDKARGTARTRKRHSGNAARDNEIMRLYKLDSKPRQIVPLLPSYWQGTRERPLTGVDVSKIISRLKNQRPNL